MTEIKGNPRVFVYGSLKKDHGNHDLLYGYNFLGRAWIEGPYRMMGMGFFPGVTDGHTSHSRIYGEVYVVDQAGLASLDLLEGHPSFYERKKVKTNVPEYGNVWCYFLQSDHSEEAEVPTGMWYPTTEEKEFWNVSDDQTRAVA